MQNLPKIKHFINNDFVESADAGWFETLNPATNRPIAHVADGQPSDVDRAVQAAHKAFTTGHWPRMNPEQRSKHLRKIADLIEKHAEAIAELEIADCGVPISQIKGGTIPRAAYNFNYFADMTYRLGGESFPVGDSFINYSLRKPVGVAGLITPWNVPFMLETWKVAPCLAFGNTCVLKPAEWSPLSAGKLAEIVQEADLPSGVFNALAKPPVRRWWLTQMCASSRLPARPPPDRRLFATARLP